MAGQKQGSARVTLREIDLSQVSSTSIEPQGVPAAIVGTSHKGPAFVPRTFANMQQFQEVFGSMTSRGRLKNSNLYAPLAFNEWMRNSQAGTFIRVLGVGDGSSAATGSGFVVGSEQVQLDPVDSNNRSKVFKNKYASIDNNRRTKATEIARTHMLGCFMKDSTGSNFLKDAGVESEGAAASLVIEFGAQPVADDTIKLDAVDAAGALNGDVTFTFGEGGVAIGANVVATLTNLKAAIEAHAQLGNAGEHRIIVSDVEDVDGDQSLARITLTSAFPEVLNSTNDCIAKFNLNPTAAGDDLKVKVGDKTASVTDATFNYGMEGGSGAKCVISITDVPANTSRLKLISLNNDNVGGLTSAPVVYEFKSAAIANAASNGGTGEVGRFASNGTNSVHVDASGTKEQALANLKAALDRAVSNHTGKYSTSISDDGLTLTVTQKQKGLAGRADHSGAFNVEVTQADSNLQISVGSDTSQTTSNAVVEFGTGTTQGFFFGGSDADSISFTMKLSGQPNDNDYLTLRMLDSGDDTNIRFENFVFEIDGVNGTKNSNSDQSISFAAGTRNPNDNYIEVKIGDDLQETLYNLKNAIKDTGNVHSHDDLKVVVDDATDSITITLFDVVGNNNNNHKSARLLLKNVINISDVATFSNPEGERLVGNYGEKSENFSGGGGAAAPVIRGILMAPQGVKPSMEVSSTVDGAYVRTNESGLALENEVDARVFGSTVNTNLAGYSIGDVTSNTFKIILNGFLNTEQSSVYTCSFNPQDDNYFAKVLNTDPTKIEELGHYLYAHWDIETTVAQVSNSGLLRGGGSINGTNYTNMTGFLISKDSSDTDYEYEKFEGRFGTAKTPWIVSQYNGGSDTSNRGTDGVHKLFKLHILDDGNSGNSLYRVLISDLRYEKDDYGTFSLTLEEYSSDSILGTPVVTWKQLNLDPNSRNYIGRVIGDKYTYYDFSSQKLRTKGNFEVRNEYVRVELSDELKRNTVNIDALPTGFKGHGYLHTTSKFTEESANGSTQLVFSDSSNDKLDKLADIKVLPLPYVTSISKKVTDNVYEATNDLAWGVKLGIKKNVNEDTNPKEHIENEFNKSLLSWAKFYPSLVYKEDNDADTFQNSFFSLEKIKIPAADISSDVITSWGQARYNRDGVYGTGGRFVSISKDAKGSNVKYLKFRCLFQGGWDGVNIFDKDKSELNGAAASRESRDEKGTSQVTGPTVMSYRKAIDVLSDKSAAEFQLLAIPGQRAFSVTDYAITACETRFDAMLVMDIEQKGANRFIEGVNDEELPHVGNTISEFAVRSLDSSFAAAYFPNVLIRRTSDSAPVEVPPSVAMIGVMSRNDTLEAPWAAPAGLTRGTLTNSIDSKVQMNRELLDDLYDNDINPIYVPAGRPGEVYAFGQKTLLQSASALDRINVRRLLIDIRRKVKKIGESLLFEPNRESTLERFSALVEPIMQDVQRRRGVARYKVLIDTTTTTQNDIENNTIRGKIYLQPTKSVEFISLDFVVANTIQ